VLAGHSFGGLHIVTFAANYPDQVAGMVLVDSTAPAADPTPPTKTDAIRDVVTTVRTSRPLPPL
jgi:pimeloyl-ACP methyl ester carboxylesterase